MLKNITKIISIFLVITLLLSTTLVFAENETIDTGIIENQVNQGETAEDGIMPISTDSNELENSISEENPEEEVDVPQNTDDSYKKSDVYLAGDNITIDYIVDGNLFICANTVTISSQIGGDAFIMAKNIVIEEGGYIFSNLFAMANDIDVKGVVYDVYALSNNFTISKGYVYRDFRISCNTLNINGSVGRNAFVNCSNINFNTDGNSNGIIYGDLNYSAKSEIEIPENIVTGKVNYSNIENNADITVSSIIASYILDLGAFLAFVIIIWLICLAIAPKFLDNTNNYVGKKTLSILGYGLLALLAIPVACIILILLQLTSAFSLFLLAAYILAIVLSKSLFTITANNYVCSKLKIDKKLPIFGMLIVSGAIIWALTKIPYVGSIISLITIILGLGILVASILPKKNKSVEVEKVSEKEND